MNFSRICLGTVHTSSQITTCGNFFSPIRSGVHSSTPFHLKKLCQVWAFTLHSFWKSLANAFVWVKTIMFMSLKIQIARVVFSESPPPLRYDTWDLVIGS